MLMTESMFGTYLVSHHISTCNVHIEGTQRIDTRRGTPEFVHNKTHKGFVHIKARKGFPYLN